MNDERSQELPTNVPPDRVDGVVSVSSVGENLTELAYQLGYHWPDDDEGRWRVLKLMATTAAHWRKEVDKCQAELWPQIERERIMQLKNQRIQSLARKLANTRKALRDFMKGQAAFVRDGLAAIRSR